MPSQGAESVLKWKIHAELQEVQGIIEVAVLELKAVGYTYELSEIEASREYKFHHNRFFYLGEVGIIKIGKLPNQELGLYALQSKLPDSEDFGLEFHDEMSLQQKIDEVRSWLFHYIVDGIVRQLNTVGLELIKWKEENASQEEKEISFSEALVSTKNPDPKPNEKPITLDKRRKSEPVLSEKMHKLNRLAVLWVDYNTNERISREAGMGWFLNEFAPGLGLGIVGIAEFKKHLPKAYAAGIIDKDEKRNRYIPKKGTETGT